MADPVECYLERSRRSAQRDFDSRRCQAFLPSRLHSDRCAAARTNPSRTRDYRSSVRAHACDRLRNATNFSMWGRELSLPRLAAIIWLQHLFHVVSFAALAPSFSLNVIARSQVGST